MSKWLQCELVAHQLPPVLNSTKLAEAFWSKKFSRFSRFLMEFLKNYDLRNQMALEFLIVIPLTWFRSEKLRDNKESALCFILLHFIFLVFNLFWSEFCQWQRNSSRIQKLPALPTTVSFLWNVYTSFFNDFLPFSLKITYIFYSFQCFLRVFYNHPFITNISRKVWTMVA